MDTEKMLSLNNEDIMKAKESLQKMAEDLKSKLEEENSPYAKKILSNEIACIGVTMHTILSMVEGE